MNGVSRCAGGLCGGEDKSYSSHSNDKGRIVGALYNVLVELNNFLDTRDWTRLTGLVLGRCFYHVLGRALWPVISSDSPGFFEDMAGKLMD